MENNIGNNIQKYRKMKQLSQKELASKLNINPSRLSNWEQDQNNPPADMIADICEALNISASELLGIKLNDNELSVEERRVLKEYRAKSSMQHAVKVLLGIERV